MPDYAARPPTCVCLAVKLSEQGKDDSRDISCGVTCLIVVTKRWTHILVQIRFLHELSTTRSALVSFDHDAVLARAWWWDRGLLRG